MKNLKRRLEQVKMKTTYSFIIIQKNKRQFYLKSLINGLAVEKNKSVAEETENIRKHLHNVLDNIKTEEQIDALKKLISPIEATMSAVFQGSKSLGTKLETNSKTPANKKILPQKRFYATKQNRTKKGKGHIQKLSLDKRNEVALKMTININ